jgi:mannose-1-phosphate guanylyltransferase
VAGPRPCLDKIDVAVLAGGQGTRIRGVLGGTPKLLAPIGGRPFLEILVQRLKAFGMKRLVLGIGHLADKVAAHLKAHPIAGVEVITAVEPKPLGTAGALQFLRPHIKSDPVIVMNGDSFCGADLCEFVAVHRRRGAQVSLLAVEVKDAARYGRLDVGDGGLVHGFSEKDADASGPGVVNAGVYLFSAALLDKIAAMSGESLEKDVFPTLLESGVNAFVTDAPFIDIGTPEDLQRAEEVLKPFISAPRRLD